MPQAAALRLAGGVWRTASMQDAAPGSYVSAAHFGPGVGWAVGSHIWRLSGNRWRIERSLELCRGGGCEQRLNSVRAIDEERAWSYEPLGSGKDGAPAHVAMADATHALVVGSQGLLLSYGYGEQAAPPVVPPAADPTLPVPDPGEPGVRYFAATGHTLRGAFRAYWEANGGLGRFGYPLSEVFLSTSPEGGGSYPAQYFERARFELHPEYAGTPYEVLLSLLGRRATAGRTQEPPFQPVAPGVRDYFPETGHALAPEFACYWRDNGGLALFGYPISEPFIEANAADGASYLVQYFERSRFELHQSGVQLGLLGSEELHARGWR